jgi:hypothetical protein
MAEHDGRLLDALEQIQNDERLTSDLTDGAARVVLAWLEDEVRAANSTDEATFAARVQALRRAVKQVARAYADDPQALIAAAKAATGGLTTPKPRKRPWTRRPRHTQGRRRGSI